MKHIDANAEELTIRRVENGWIIGSGSRLSQRDVPTSHVARSPKELADLLLHWAEQQHDGAYLNHQ